MDDDEPPIPVLDVRVFANHTRRDTDIMSSFKGYLYGFDSRDAAIMLALTQLQGIRPDRKRLALFLKYAG